MDVLAKRPELAGMYATLSTFVAKTALPGISVQKSRIQGFPALSSVLPPGYPRNDLWLPSLPGPRQESGNRARFPPFGSTPLVYKGLSAIAGRYLRPAPVRDLSGRSPGSFCVSCMLQPMLSSLAFGQEAKRVRSTANTFGRLSSRRARSVPDRFEPMLSSLAFCQSLQNGHLRQSHALPHAPNGHSWDFRQVCVNRKLELIGIPTCRTSQIWRKRQICSCSARSGNPCFCSTFLSWSSLGIADAWPFSHFRQRPKELVLACTAKPRRQESTLLALLAFLAKRPKRCGTAITIEHGISAKRPKC